MQSGENQARVLSSHCTWLMHNPSLCKAGCGNLSFPVRNWTPAHGWHILNWTAKINKVVTKISLSFYLDLGIFEMQNLTFLLLKGKKKHFISSWTGRGMRATPSLWEMLLTTWLIHAKPSFEVHVINPRWCPFQVPNFSSSALPGTTYDMQRKTVPWVLSTHPKFNHFPFFYR